MPIDIREWQENHELNICELNEQDKMELHEAVDEAVHESALQDFIEEQISGFQEEFREDYDEYIKDLIRDIIADREDDAALPSFEEWVKEHKEDEIRDKFYGWNYLDDYYPLWCYAWQFPSNYSAQELNAKGVSGLVFFDFHGTTMVSLTTVGMDMSPSIYFAYLMYSALDIDHEPILQKIMTSGKDYFSYVVGTADFNRVVEKLGRAIVDKYHEEGQKRYQEFDETLERLTKLRDEGKMDKTETGLLGLMALSKTQKPMEK